MFPICSTICVPFWIRFIFTVSAGYILLKKKMKSCVCSNKLCRNNMQSFIKTNGICINNIYTGVLGVY